MSLPRLLVLTDRIQIPDGRALVDIAAACVGAGATHILLRELDLNVEERSALSVELLRIPGLVLITARVPLPGSDCVHLSARQPPISARFRGRSTHNEQEIIRARVEGVTYVTVSPAAPSESKPGYGPPLGAEGIRRLVGAAGQMPVFALGGVMPANAGSFVAAGAHGVAVMGSVMKAADPGRLVEQLLAAVSVPTQDGSTRR